jgi:hypothetical protein
MSDPQPVNTTTPIPSGDTSSGTPAAATLSSIPFSLGPQPATGPAPTQPVTQPVGNNSAPPAITNPTPATKPTGPNIAEVIGFILFVILSGFGIYYGWVLGMQKGREYLLFIQSFGPWLRSWFVRTPRAPIV